MPLNSVLAYLGLMGMLIGGLGLAYQAVVPRHAVEDAPAAATAEITASVPAMPTTVPISERSAWPLEPRHAAVPFHETMLELLTPPMPPPAPEPPAQTAAAPAEPDVTVGVGTREAEPPRAIVREPARERVKDKRKERKAKTEPKAKPAEADDDASVEVEVRDQTGRRLRTERVPRERVERTAREEREPRRFEQRRFEERRDEGGERRGFGFPLFGIFGGDRW
jgi:hypothetical protein